MNPKTLIFTVMLIAMSQVCWGQELTAPQAGGTRAFSMGGVYTATNQGIDALSGNPGGLALLDSAQFLAGGRVRLLGKSDYEEDYYEDLGYKDYSSKFGINPKLLNLGVAFPITLSGFSHKLVGAVGYRSFYDWSSKEITKAVDKDDNKYEVTENTHGLVNMLSFGLGTTISEKYSFGASFNLPMIKGYKYEMEYETKDAYGTSKEKYEEEWDVSGGSFIQMGGIVQLNPELTIGASYIMGHKFELEDGKWKEKSDGDVTSGKYTYDTKYEIPSLYSMGVSYKFTPDLLISAELQNRPWEDIEINNYELDDVESGQSYRFGLEYGYSSDILLRGGFAMERLPIIDSDLDPVNINSITGGIGYKSDNIILDVGAAYRFTTFEASDTWDYNFNELVLYATLQYSFGFSLGQ